MTIDAADRIEIHELYGRYCHALDVGRPEEWAACFTDDGAFQRVDGDEVLMELRGSSDLRSFAETVQATEQGSIRRWNANVHLWLQDGEVRGASYLSMVKVVDEATRSDDHAEDLPQSLYAGDLRIVVTSRTSDVLVATDAGWRFQQRRVSVDQR